MSKEQWQAVALISIAGNSLIFLIHILWVRRLLKAMMLLYAEIRGHATALGVAVDATIISHYPEIEKRVEARIVAHLPEIAKAVSETIALNVRSKERYYTVTSPTREEPKCPP